MENEKLLVVATHNKGKVVEIQAVLSKFGYKVVTRDEVGIPRDFDVVEDGETFEENSYIKAKAILDMCNMPTLADDSGIMIDYLDGAPGVYSARFSPSGDDKDNNLKVLELLEGVPMEKRGAHYVAVITLLYPDGRKFVARGECHGKIAFEETGTNGFGYDPLFIPEGFNESFGIIPSDVKNGMSHRGKALEILEGMLEKDAN